MKNEKKSPKKRKVKNRSRLRSLLESYLGEVSDKTWQRVRNERLMISNELMYGVHELAVRGYALKRLLRPNDSINREEAEIFGLIASQFEHLFSGIVYGSDLRELCSKCFKRFPSTRWFNYRGVHMGREVAREQALEVLAAIATRKRFLEPKPKHEIPRIKSITEQLEEVVRAA